MGLRKDVDLPRVWPEPPTEEEIEAIWEEMEKALEEEEYAERVRKAEEDLVAWKELLDFVEDLLKADGITNEVVRIELYELVSDDDDV
jgi:hypothetical protein